MNHTKEIHAIGLGLIEELPKLTNFKYIHDIREIAVSNDQGEPIAVIDLDGTINIWTANNDKGPIGITARIEYANPNFLDEIVTTLIKMDIRTRHHQRQLQPINMPANPPDTLAEGNTTSTAHHGTHIRNNYCSDLACPKAITPA